MSNKKQFHFKHGKPAFEMTMPSGNKRVSRIPIPVHRSVKPAPTKPKAQRIAEAWNHWRQLWKARRSERKREWRAIVHRHSQLKQKAIRGWSQWTLQLKPRLLEMNQCAHSLCNRRFSFELLLILGLLGLQTVRD